MTSEGLTVKSSGPATATGSKAQFWAGWVLSALPVLMLAMSATMKLTHAPMLVEQLVGKFGFQEGVMTGIGIVELACALIFAIPRTAVLGAILITGYLGGAVVTHLRVGDNFAIPIVLGILPWAGLYLRDGRHRDLLPLRNVAPVGTKR